MKKKRIMKLYTFRLEQNEIRSLLRHVCIGLNALRGKEFGHCISQKCYLLREIKQFCLYKWNFTQFCIEPLDLEEKNFLHFVQPPFHLYICNGNSRYVRFVQRIVAFTYAITSKASQQTSNIIRFNVSTLLIATTNNCSVTSSAASLLTLQWLPNEENKSHSKSGS